MAKPIDCKIMDYANYPSDQLLIAHRAGRAYAQTSHATDEGAYIIVEGLGADQRDFFMAGYRNERRKEA